MIELYLTESQIVAVKDLNINAIGKKVEIKILSKYDLRNAVIFFRNGEIEKKVEFSAKTVIPEEVMFGGKIYIDVRLYSGEKTVKVWNVEPITVFERKTDFELIPWSRGIEKRLAALEEQQKIIF